MSEEKANLQGKSQSEAQIAASASTKGGGPPVDTTPWSRRRTGPADQARSIIAAFKHMPPPHTCQQWLQITIFFDGTGNNRDADVHTLEHSNVARMFRAMPDDDESRGIYSRYVPGIGTLFPEIGDSGKGKIIDTHNAMGAMGQARLDWAFKELQKIIGRAKLRAMNPTNKITQITLAVFGFSRGATLARAFVRDLVNTGWCTGSGTALRWKDGGYPLEISFLGLWDTVAAVGAPIGVNNVGAIRRARVSAANVVRSNNIVRSVAPGEKYLRAVDLAFGAPGADPAPGPANGHDAWAENLTIPDAVRSCVHMVAAHEIRNSFPLDSVAHGNSKPANCKEIVFPGVHSNVGGGYRPGEGGRGQPQPMDVKNADANLLLSLIPLKAMYCEALIAGVPLLQMDSSEWKRDNIEDFGVSEKLLDSFDHYMSIADRAHAGIGDAFLSHQRLYFAWRFHHIGQKEAVRPQLEQRDPKRMTDEERAIEQSESVWSQDEMSLKAQQAKLQAEINKLNADRMTEQQALAHKAGMVDSNTLLTTPRGQQESAAINAKYDEKIADRKRRIDEVQARIDTLPSQGRLVKGLSEYDQTLMDDAGAIVAAMNKDHTLRAQLRPHYKALVEAYENEFIHRRGLDENKPDDRKLIEFFDLYVHDSLANFQVDSTLPSDPRVIYVGGDLKSRHAAADPDGIGATAAA